jgi:translation initiation factor 1
MDNDWKKRLGVVYSTDENFSFETEHSEQTETPPAHQQNLTVALDKRNRKGKSVTLITGFRGSTDDLEDLGKKLKTSCGVGGSVKENQVLLQGDHRDKVVKLLQTYGFKVKRSGG